MTEFVYLGPAGRLMPIEVPLAGFDDGPTVYGFMHEALSGSHTKDVFGWKREYSFPLGEMDDRTLSWFEMMLRGSLKAPYFLLDPRRTNRLATSVSDTMSSHERPAKFFTVNTSDALDPVGVAAFMRKALRSRNDMDTVITTPGPSFGAKWDPINTASTLYTTVAGYPILPGETVIFSYHLESGTAPVPKFTGVNITGAVSQSTTPTVSTDADEPTRRYVSFTASPTTVRVLPYFQAGDANAVVLYAMQLEADTPTHRPSPWSLGSGVPEVIFDEFSQHAVGRGRRTSGSLKLIEA